MDSEFFLAMLGANSQAEGEAASSRVKWGVRAAFRDGKVRYQYKRWLGYRKGEDGKPEIVPEETPESLLEKKIYSSKYALSGVLFCGMCGAPYRRCTWKRNGKTRIVWRCQNRLKNGTKVCADSPSIDENDLHQALVAGINEMLHQQEYLLAPFEKLGITERRQALVSQQKQMDANIVDLIVQYADSWNWDHSAEPFRKLLKKRRKLPQSANQLPCQLERYHDGIARCALEKVTVLDTGRLQIAFKGGASAEQPF